MRTLLLGLLVLGSATRWAAHHLTAVTVTGDSMAPTYLDGDRVLVLRVPADRLLVGDAVVLRLPTGTRDRPWLVKRIAALPGDPVPNTVVPSVGDSHVPAGRLVVLSDSPAGAIDSRVLGYVDAGAVLGRAITRMG
jgi:signal peptidase I